MGFNMQKDGNIPAALAARMKAFTTDPEQLPGYDAAKCDSREAKEILTVDLTDGEVAERAEEAAILRQRAENLEEEMKRTAKDFKDRIGGIVTDAKDLDKKVISRKEERKLPVIMVRDYRRNLEICFRLDRLDPEEEQTKQRTLSPDEIKKWRQLTMDPVVNAPVPDPATGEVPLDINALLSEADEAIRLAWDTIKAGQVESMGRGAVKFLVKWAHAQGLEPDDHGPIQDAISDLSRRTGERKAAETAKPDINSDF